MTIYGNAPLFNEMLPRFGAVTNQAGVFGVQYASHATAAASATAVGSFGLFNPSGSGKVLVLLQANFVLNSVAATTNVLTAGYQLIPSQTPSSQTAGNTPQCMLIGSAATASAIALTAGTVVSAPTTTPRIGASWYVDLAAGDIQTSIVDNIDGAIIVGQNSTLAIVSIANTPTILLSLVWAEVSA